MTDDCTHAVANYLTLVVLNVVLVLRQTPSRVDLLTDRSDRTDVAILSIPVPLLWKVKLPLGRKIAIGVLLCSGVFIIIATLLRCILSLQSIQGINISTIWAIRETVSRHFAIFLQVSLPLLSSL